MSRANSLRETQRGTHICLRNALLHWLNQSRKTLCWGPLCRNTIATTFVNGSSKTTESYIGTLRIVLKSSQLFTQPACCRPRFPNDSLSGTATTKSDVVALLSASKDLLV